MVIGRPALLGKCKRNINAIAIYIYNIVIMSITTCHVYSASVHVCHTQW